MSDIVLDKKKDYIDMMKHLTANNIQFESHVNKIFNGVFYMSSYVITTKENK